MEQVSQASEVHRGFFGAPVRVFFCHAANQTADFIGDLWPAAAPAGPPTPVQPKTRAMPADDGLGLDDDEDIGPTRPNVSQSCPEQPVDTVQRRPRPSGFENGNLLPEGEDLQCIVAPAAVEFADRSQDGEKAGAVVSKYLVRHREPSSQTWRTILENHIKNMVSVDFFTVPTILPQMRFARCTSRSRAVTAQPRRGDRRESTPVVYVFDGRLRVEGGEPHSPLQRSHGRSSGVERIERGTKRRLACVPIVRLHPVPSQTITGGRKNGEGQVHYHSARDIRTGRSEELPRGNDLGFRVELEKAGIDEPTSPQLPREPLHAGTISGSLELPPEGIRRGFERECRQNKDAVATHTLYSAGRGGNGPFKVTAGGGGITCRR
jgi:hypothetical protein